MQNATRPRRRLGSTCAYAEPPIEQAAGKPLELLQESRVSIPGIPVRLKDGTMQTKGARDERQQLTEDLVNPGRQAGQFLDSEL